MRRLASALALAIAGFLVAPAAPAMAGPCGSDAVCVSVKHRNDIGFDPVILVRCSHDPGVNYGIPEYWWDPCIDVIKVYTPPGQELWGWRGNGTKYKYRDATGWSDSGNLGYRYLTVERD